MSATRLQDHRDRRALAVAKVEGPVVLVGGLRVVGDASAGFDLREGIARQAINRQVESDVGNRTNSTDTEPQVERGWHRRKSLHDSRRGKRLVCGDFAGEVAHRHLVIAERIAGVGFGQQRGRGAGLNHDRTRLEDNREAFVRVDEHGLPVGRLEAGCCCGLHL